MFAALTHRSRFAMAHSMQSLTLCDAEDFVCRKMQENGILDGGIRI
jgi:hypothetical protein